MIKWAITKVFDFLADTAIRLLGRTWPDDLDDL